MQHWQEVTSLWTSPQGRAAGETLWRTAAGFILTLISNILENVAKTDWIYTQHQRSSSSPPQPHDLIGQDGIHPERWSPAGAERPGWQSSGLWMIPDQWHHIFCPDTKETRKYSHQRTFSSTEADVVSISLVQELMRPSRAEVCWYVLKSHLTASNTRTRMIWL